MGKVLTLDDIVAKARAKHGNKYEYNTLIKEKGEPIKVECVCPLHGVFTIRAARHYTEGKGCPKCSTITSLDEFKRRAKTKHGDKYDYSKVAFNTLKDKVTIVCPEHGEFKQKANDHILYYGCPDCGVSKRAKSKTKTTEEFKQRAADKKITITCPDHGEFEQAAIIHVSGQGCPKCGRDRTTAAKRNNPDANGWSYSNWENAGSKSKLFVGFQLYIIECAGNGEKFTKVGKTFTSIGERFKGNTLPYEWKLVKSIVGSANYISRLEEELHRNLKDAGNQYVPKIKFNGMHECYSINYKELKI
jgi:Zn finger protein HypA/HybF involved in hydrogenase expression